MRLIADIIRANTVLITLYFGQRFQKSGWQHHHVLLTARVGTLFPHKSACRLIPLWEQGHNSMSCKRAHKLQSLALCPSRVPQDCSESYCPKDLPHGFNVLAQAALPLPPKASMRACGRNGIVVIEEILLARQNHKQDEHRKQGERRKSRVVMAVVNCMLLRLLDGSKLWFQSESSSCFWSGANSTSFLQARWCSQLILMPWTAVPATHHGFTNQQYILF